MKPLTWLNQPDGEFLRVGTACEYYPFTESYLRKLILNRRVPFYKVGRMVLLKRADLESFIANGFVPVGGEEVGL